ncbi:hypothetical protein EDB80DRAFT_782706 [Ilyonectria destructans]|nr:hypothetical protein EDB80DRAFT_782706 [Ilyonectria destructans]
MPAVWDPMSLPNQAPNCLPVYISIYIYMSQTLVVITLCLSSFSTQSLTEIVYPIRLISILYFLRVVAYCSYKVNSTTKQFNFSHRKSSFETITMSVTTNSAHLRTPGTVGMHDSRPRSACIDDLGLRVRHVASAEGFPPGHCLSFSGTMERTNLDFCNTLADFSDTLRRLNDQQKATLFWQRMYEGLRDDYRNLDQRYEAITGKNLMMSIEIAKMDDLIKILGEKIRGREVESIEIAKMDDLIKILEEKIRGIEVEMASRSLTTFMRRDDTENASDPGELGGN